MDPLADEPHSVGINPYHFVANNPIVNVDPFGLDWFRNSDGQATWFDSSDDTYTDDDGNEYENIGEYYVMEGKDGYLIHRQNEVIAQVGSVSAGIAGQGVAREDLVHAGDFYMSKRELFDAGVANMDYNDWILKQAPLSLQKEYFAYARDKDLGEAIVPVAMAVGAPVAMIAGAELGAAFTLYPRAGGFGFDFRSIRFDWHRIRLGGRRIGKDYNLPHIDIPGKVKHWPWHQISKWWRGVR